MYKLYGMSAAGQICVEAVFALAGLVDGQDYTIEYIKKDEQGKMPESFRLINPASQVPTLVMPDGTIVSESGAILLILADTLPKANLSFSDQSHKNQLYRWVFYCAVNYYGNILRGFYSERYTVSSDQAPEIKAKALDLIAINHQMLSDLLGDKDYLLGKLTVLDVYFAMLYEFVLELVPADFTRPKNLDRLYQRLCQLPAIHKIWQREGLKFVK